MRIHVADLFCGAGGTSAGVYDAADRLWHTVDLLAVNHWPVAIATHSRNHSLATHLCESLDNVEPRKVVPGGHLHLLVASPECTHHSNARGGKPRDEQSRATAWHVLRWMHALSVDNVIIENVPEFQTWRPIRKDGKPDHRFKPGCTYTAFLDALRGSGYRVEARVLNAADYGDATARRRLFIICRRGTRRIRWPEPTHGPGRQNSCRTAREIIDWEYPSQSIFDRKRPLCQNTLRRIAAGLRKFGGPAAEPFLVLLNGGGCLGEGGARSLDKPLPTIAGEGGHMYLAEPFVVNMKGKSDASSIDAPLPTQTTSKHQYLCQPFVMHLTHRRADKHYVHSVDNPLPTVTGAHRGEMAIIQPFLTAYYRTGTPQSVDEPLCTCTAKPRFGLAQPVVDGCRIDIRFRMLQPHELAAAMGMEDFEFTGNKGDVVKQIGNAVARNQATALALSVLPAA
jgi:DNA (cytosine-5)-methyltransferase 1